MITSSHCADFYFILFFSLSQNSHKKHSQYKSQFFCSFISSLGNDYFFFTGFFSTFLLCLCGFQLIASNFVCAFLCVFVSIVVCNGVFFPARLLLLLRVQHTQQKLGREIPPQSFHSLYSRLCLISSHALMVLRSCFGFL